MLSGTSILFASNSNPAWNFSICEAWKTIKERRYIVKALTKHSSTKDQRFIPLEVLSWLFPNPIDGSLVYRSNDYVMSPKIFYDTKSIV